MSVYVSLKPEVSKWMADHADMSVFDEGSAKDSKFLAFLMGEGKVTMKQVSEISRRTHIPYGYFFMSRVPERSVPLMEFRTVGSTVPADPSADLFDTIQTMRARQSWARSELIRQGIPPLPLPKLSYTSKSAVPEAARQLRKLLRIRENWFEDKKSISDFSAAITLIRGRIDDAGIFVMQNGIVGNNTKRPLDVDEFRAFALADPYAPLIFINRRDADAGRLFSLVHELVHVCLGRSDLYNAAEYGARQENPNKTETFCNAVAGELLVPAHILRERWENASGDKEERIETLLHDFWCSRIVLARRALDTQCITKQEYTDYAEYLASTAYRGSIIPDNEGSKRGGNTVRTTISRISKRFLEMVIYSTEHGDTMYTDAFRLTGTNRRSFGSFVKNAKEGEL